MFGYSKQDLLEMNASELVPEGQDVYTLRSGMVTDRTLSPVETVNLHADGTPIPVEITLREQEIGGVIVQLVVVRDITERKRAEAHILQQIGRLEALREIDLAIVHVTDIETTFNVFLSHLTDKLAVDAACVLLLNRDENRFKYVAGSGFRTDALQYTSLAMGEGCAGKVALEGKPLLVIGKERLAGAFSPLQNLSRKVFTPITVRCSFRVGKSSGLLKSCTGPH